MLLKKITVIFAASAACFFAACDDSSSASDDNNSSSSTEIQSSQDANSDSTGQSDTFSLKEEYSYYVAYDDETATCGQGLSISTVTFDFGPENNVKVSIKNADGITKLSGVYTKEEDEDDELEYMMQLKYAGVVTTWIYSPGEEGGFMIVMDGEDVPSFSAYVPDKQSVDETMAECLSM